MPPISENTYRAPRTVAEYVARRLIRGEIDAIPYLTTPAGSSLSDFCSAVTDLFRGLTASLRFTQRQRGQNNGLEKTIVSLEKHGEELGRSMVNTPVTLVSDGRTRRPSPTHKSY